MVIIDNTIVMARALDQPIDLELKRLLALRRDQLANDDEDLGTAALFIIVEPGDPVGMIETAAGYPVVTYGAFDWVQQHGHWYEAVAILSDDGFATVLFVPEDDRIDATLLAYLREEVASDQPITSSVYEAGQPITPLG